LTPRNYWDLALKKTIFKMTALIGLLEVESFQVQSWIEKWYLWFNDICNWTSEIHFNSLLK
jgi:hypothetical protein